MATDMATVTSTAAIGTGNGRIVAAADITRRTRRNRTTGNTRTTINNRRKVVGLITTTASGRITTAGKQVVSGETA